MQVNGALEALALRHAADVHLVARREPVDPDLLARGEPVDVVEPDLAEHAHRRQVFEVTELRLRHAIGLLRPPESELDGGVAISFLRADLRHDVRLGDNDRRPDDRAVFLEVLKHAELAAKEHRLFECRGGIGRLRLLVLLFHFCLVGHLFCLLPLELDLDIDARRKVQLHEGVDRFLRRVVDIDKALVRADLDLLDGVLVYERAPDVRDILDTRRYRVRAGDRRPGPLRRLDDLRRGLVDELVVVRLEADPDALLRHYASTFVTTPAPTVCPPSRMANRRPSSSAIGVMSVTSSVELSPGMIISVPVASFASPVTSVVRT